MWRLIFKNETNRGSGIDRDPGTDEFDKWLQKEQSAWFRENPERYIWSGTGISEYSGWEVEQAQEKLLLDQGKMTAEIMAEEDRRSYLPLAHNGHTYKVSSAIQDTKLIILGSELTDPIPLNGGCWDDVEGAPVPMTVGEFYALAQAAYTRGAMNYAVRKAHIVAMKELEDPTIYDYSGGWA